jgi:hypothetical protein
MKNAANTPTAGPWRWIVGISRYDENIQILVAQDGTRILECVATESPQRMTGLADAHLIAAAPDMLTMCRTMHGMCMAVRAGQAVDIDAIEAAAVAAIAKASGSAA